PPSAVAYSSSVLFTGVATVQSCTLSLHDALPILTAPQPSFMLSASPSSLSIPQGASGTSTISVTPQNGFTGSVSLSASGLPSGVARTSTRLNSSHGSISYAVACCKDTTEPLSVVV